MSMMEYMMKKSNALAQVFNAIPKHATYTSHEIQIKITELMNEIVTSEIVEEMGIAGTC